MRTFHKLILLVAVLLTSVAAEAQLRTSYFMRGSYFRTELNPALTPTRGYIALPGMSGIGASITSDFLSVENLYQRVGNEYVSIFDNSISQSEALSRFADESHLSLSANVNVLGLGFYSKRTYWNIGLNSRVQGAASFSNSLISSMKGAGNVVNGHLDASGFLEAYLGTSFYVHKNVNIGVRVKALFGVMNIAGDMRTGSRISDTYHLNGDYQLTGMFMRDIDPELGRAYDGEEVYDAKIGSLFRAPLNAGFAADLGTEVRLFRDRLKISASVVDLGFIAWNGAGSKSYNINAKLDMSDSSINGIGNIANTKLQHYGALGSGGENLKKMLHGSFNIGLEYNFLYDYMSIGLLSHNVFYDSAIQSSELTASLNIRPTNWISATVSKTFFMGDDYGIFGVALNVHARAVNLFVGADFVDFKSVSTSKGTVIFERPLSRSLYVGLGFNFSRPQHIRLASAEAKAARRDARALRKESKQ
jgi:hypothetical protein